MIQATAFLAVALMTISHQTALDKPLHEGVVERAPGVCPIGQYKASKIDVNLEIPDNDPVGIETPRIKFNPQPGVIITDVIIDLEIEHTYVGDLIVTVKHTASDGTVKTVDLLQQPGVPETTFGCSGNPIADPENKFYFGTRTDLEPIGEFDCPTEIPGGCYAVAVENPNGLEIFRGQPKGDGEWTLCISDNAGGDTGFVYNWSVHLLCEAPVSVEDESWGGVKAKYQR